MTKRIALFPGSFDPFTKGHQDIVLRGAALFDEVVIGVGVNSNKQRFFPLDLILSKIEDTFADHGHIRAMSYKGLTAVFAAEIKATVLLRGLRNTTDFEYENAIAQANRYVFEKLETVFIITSPHLTPISSSIVRDLYRHGQNVDAFLPYTL